MRKNTFWSICMVRLGPESPFCWHHFTLEVSNSTYNTLNKHTITFSESELSGKLSCPLPNTERLWSLSTKTMLG